MTPNEEIAYMMFDLFLVTGVNPEVVFDLDEHAPRQARRRLKRALRVLVADGVIERVADDSDDEVYQLTESAIAGLLLVVGKGAPADD